MFYSCRIFYKISGYSIWEGDKGIAQEVINLTQVKIF